MNAHAVQVERGYRRPVMSAFHATFSLGGVLAAVVGARTLSWGWSPAVTLGGVALLGLVAAALARPRCCGPNRPLVRRPRATRRRMGALLPSAAARRHAAGLPGVSGLLPSSPSC